jgi:hypothetical protein
MSILIFGRSGIPPRVAVFSSRYEKIIFKYANEAWILVQSQLSSAEIWFSRTRVCYGEIVFF